MKRMNEKFCVECGKKLPVSARYCDACGMRQPEIMIPPEVNAVKMPEPVADKAGEAEPPAETELSAAKAPESEPEPVQSGAAADNFAQQPPPPISQQPPEPQYSPIPEDRTESGINPAYLLLIVLALAIVAILIGFMFAMNKGMIDDKSSSSSREISYVEATKATAATTRQKRVTGGVATEAVTEPTTDDGYFGVGGSTGEVYPEGGYIVGRDIPAGEYVIIVDKDAIRFYDEMAENGEYYEPNIYVRVNEGEKDYIRGWVENSMYVKVRDGQHLEVTHADIYEIDDARAKLDPFSHSGTFIVGRDVEPGTYKVVSTTDQDYVDCVIYDSLDEMMNKEDYIINDHYSDIDNGTVTLKEGQVLSMFSCKLEK